jgi:hypothetical protein
MNSTILFAPLLAAEPGAGRPDHPTPVINQISLPFGQEIGVHPELIGEKFRGDVVIGFGFNVKIRPMGFVTRLIPTEGVGCRQDKLWDLIQIVADHINANVFNLRRCR